MGRCFLNGIEQNSIFALIAIAMILYSILYFLEFRNRKNGECLQSEFTDSGLDNPALMSIRFLQGDVLPQMPLKQVGNPHPIFLIQEMGNFKLD